MFVTCILSYFPGFLVDLSKQFFLQIRNRDLLVFVILLRVKLRIWCKKQSKMKRMLIGTSRGKEMQTLPLVISELSKGI